MRTRISKHGKYEIMEGSYGEMKDLLQPGDILRTLDDVPKGMKRSDFDVRLVRRIPSQEIMDQVMDNLPFPSMGTAIFAMVESPTEGFSHSWAVQTLKSGMEYVWFGEHDDTPCVIKRRIDKETTTPEPQEETKPQVPTEPGLYRDRIDDYVLFHHVCGSEKLHYTNLTCGEKLNNWPRAYEVEDDYNVLQNYAPYTRVTAIKDVEVAP